jgi:uncharacterized protein (TIGR02246 family)
MHDVTEKDRTALNEKLTRLAAAWANGDADAYANEFSEDAQYIAFDGSRMSGRAAIAAGHRPLFTGFLRGSKLHAAETEIRFVAPDVALILARGAVLKRHQRTPSKRRLSVNTTVAVRREGHWVFVAFQNTRYRPFADTLLGKLVGLSNQHVERS